MSEQGVSVGKVRAFRAGAAVIAGVAVMTIAACSPSLEQDSDLPPGAEPTLNISAPASAQPSDAHHGEGAEGGECAVDAFKVKGKPGSKPTPVVPEDCTPPEKVLTKTLEEGSGPEVAEGDTVEVDYVVVGLTGGKEEATWSSKTDSEPRQITVGEGEIAPGVDKALVGLQQGARTLVVVPPGSGDGGEGTEDAEGLGFAADETLVLVIDVV